MIGPGEYEVLRDYGDDLAIKRDSSTTTYVLSPADLQRAYAYADEETPGIVTNTTTAAAMAAALMNAALGDRIERLTDPRVFNPRAAASFGRPPVAYAARPSTQRRPSTRRGSGRVGSRMMGRRSFTSQAYRVAPCTRTVEAVSRGRGLRRARSIAIGRAAVRVGLFRRMWGGRRTG